MWSGIIIGGPVFGALVGGVVWDGHIQTGTHTGTHTGSQTDKQTDSDRQGWGVVGGWPPLSGFRTVRCGFRTHCFEISGFQKQLTSQFLYDHPMPLTPNPTIKIVGVRGWWTFALRKQKVHGWKLGKWSF